MTRSESPSAPNRTGADARHAWIRALELTAPIARNPETILFDVIGRVADARPDAPALLAASETFSYRELVEKSNRYARWAITHKLGQGDTVCLLMPNRPEYIAVWLGVTATGCSVALLNAKLVGSSLAHCVRVVSASHVIVAAELLENLDVALGLSAIRVTTWVHGRPHAAYRNIEDKIHSLSGDRLDDWERRAVTGRSVTINDRALFIYTSGTTGLPKAVNVSHGRIMQWSLWFAGLTQTNATDRIYNCLPMYHSVGGIVATGPLLATGGAVVIRDEFSASQFWTDIVRWECTLFQYIGELCRYLLRTGPIPEETSHRVRTCIGNGLSREIWHDFKSRFRIPQILEFYAATEGSVSLFNVECEPGALGRVPSYLAYRFPIELIKWDESAEAPLRDSAGFCIRTGPNEVGEAIGPIPTQETGIGNAFEGYTSEEATREKILHDVFKSGDAWFRTRDLMRRDKRGYYYFVDRTGDTFRWKGENVSTSEVEQVICSFPGIRQANVYGVSVPHADGKAGMAAMAVGSDFPLDEFYSYLGRHLPDFAHPVFLRFCDGIEMTATFRNMKEYLFREGFDPSAVKDNIFFRDRQMCAFVPLDKILFHRIQSGEIIV